MTQPHLLRLRRIVIAEADQFPDLARTWYADGPERAHATLARQLDALAAAGSWPSTTLCSPPSTSTG